MDMINLLDEILLTSKGVEKEKLITLKNILVDKTFTYKISQNHNKIFLSIFNSNVSNVYLKIVYIYPWILSSLFSPISFTSSMKWDENRHHWELDIDNWIKINKLKKYSVIVQPYCTTFESSDITTLHKTSIIL
jgi:hypothetical protein